VLRKEHSVLLATLKKGYKKKKRCFLCKRRGWGFKERWGEGRERDEEEGKKWQLIGIRPEGLAAVGAG